MEMRTLIVGILSFGLVGALAGCGGDDHDDGHGNPAGVGNYCESDDDCDTGECYQGPEQGYCTAECDAEGNVDECPEDTVCKPIQGGAKRCLLICGSDSACGDAEDCGDEYCPNGSSCVNVSETDHSGCEPDPG